MCLAYQSSSNTHISSANTQVVRHPEIKSPNQVKMSDVTNYWDDYLGSNQTNIHPRTGLVDNDRIFSADGTKSIRFGNHEMDSMGMILSILVDTFISKISFPMQPGPEIGSISDA